MTAGPRPILPDRLASQHFGRYVLIAIALHAAVLFYPRAVDISEALPRRPIMLNLHESATPPQIKPPTLPEKAPTPEQPRRDKAPPLPRPVLAMTPEQQNTPSAATVASPVVAQTTPSAAPTPTTLAVQATYSAPAFNVAYLQNPDPKYPAISRRMGEEGKVLLKVRVTPDGRAASVNLETSSGYDRLDESAREAVGRWRFIPAKRGDEAIEATVIVPIVFRLDN